MISVTSLRPGTTYEENGEIYEVLSYNNVHLRKTSSVVKVKVRNVRKNFTLEKSYPSNGSANPVTLQKKDMQFLYKDTGLGYFMNPQTFEQINIPLSNLPGHEYLKEGENVNIKFHGDEALGIALAPKVKLKVTDTNPGVKGNSATNVYKDAVLENGIKTKVPLFIKNGDEIIIDTRDGSYTSRA